MKVAFAPLLFMHGLIHLSIAAGAFGFADMPLLEQQLSRLMGFVWLCGELFLVAAAHAGCTQPDRSWTIAR